MHNSIALQPNPSAWAVHERIAAALMRGAHTDSSHIDVLAEPGGVVTVRDTVPSCAERGQVETAAWATAGVTAVATDLKIDA